MESVVAALATEVMTLVGRIMSNSHSCEVGILLFRILGRSANLNESSAVRSRGWDFGTVLTGIYLGLVD